MIGKARQHAINVQIDKELFVSRYSPALGARSAHETHLTASTNSLPNAGLIEGRGGTLLLLDHRLAARSAE